MLDNSTGFYFIVRSRAKPGSLFKKNNKPTFRGLFLPTCELYPPVQNKFFLCILSHVLTSKCKKLSLLQFSTPALWFTNPPTQKELNKGKLLHPQNLFFPTLFLPQFLSPFYYCLLFDLVPLLMSCLQKAAETEKPAEFHFHSAFLFLHNTVTCTPTPNCICYPIYPLSDDRY